MSCYNLDTNEIVGILQMYATQHNLKFEKLTIEAWPNIADATIQVVVYADGHQRIFNVNPRMAERPFEEILNYLNPWRQYG